MTDRELLELAAKAAGIGLIDGEHGDMMRVYYTDPNNGLERYTSWNPLTDDGDALRLAVKLGLFMRQAVKEIPRSEYEKDPYAATRRAIVRAAAAMGAST